MAHAEDNEKASFKVKFWWNIYFPGFTVIIKIGFTNIKFELKALQLWRFLFRHIKHFNELVK